MHVGDIEVRYLHGGSFYLDGGAMFGMVSKPLWEKKAPADEQNRIRLAANLLLVRAGRKNIVVETGNGTKWDAKLRHIYGIQEGDPLRASLEKNGIEPEEIDVVINTHLHFDHAGGNTRSVNDQDVLSFPNAQYVVQRGELEHAMSPTERHRASYFPDRFVPVTAAGQWQLVEGNVEIVQGISVVRIPGHNATIQAVKIGNADDCVLFVADLIPTRHHLPLPWIMAYDLYPLQTLESKRKWVAEIIHRKWTVVFGHDPDYPATKLHEHGGKIEVEPVDLNR